MPMIQFVTFEIVTSVTISSADLISHGYPSSNMKYEYHFCHVLYSPPISMLVNRVFEISRELKAELVLTIMLNALRVFVLLSNSVYMLFCL